MVKKVYKISKGVQVISQGLFSFKGRIPRKEFWTIQIGLILLGALFIALLYFFKPERASEGLLLDLGFMLIFVFLYVITVSFINLATIVKRLHDFNVSGWFALLIILLGAFDQTGIITLITMIILGSIPSVKYKTVYENDFSCDECGAENYGGTFSCFNCGKPLTEDRFIETIKEDKYKLKAILKDTNDFSKIKELIMKQYKPLGYTKLVIDKEDSFMLNDEPKTQSYVNMKMKDYEITIEAFNTKEPTIIFDAQEYWR